jgi:hypothetical protein
VRNAGEDGRGELSGDGAIRDWNRRSNGRKEGIGLPRPGLEATDGNTLLPGEERTDPYERVSSNKS